MCPIQWFSGHNSATDTKVTQKVYVAPWLKSLLQKYSLLIWQWTFSLLRWFFFFSLSSTILLLDYRRKRLEFYYLPNLTTPVTRLEFYYLPSASTWVDPRVLVGSVLLIFSVFCILFFFLLRLVSRVHTYRCFWIVHSRLPFRLSLSAIWL